MADMDNQPMQDLNAAAAIEKLKELAERARTCMFTTALQQVPPSTRPMSLQEVDSTGTLWFISSTESNKNKEIQADNHVQLTFQNDGKYEYVAVYGTATIHTDKATIDKYWTEFANAWFDGKDDPRVSIISIKPEDGYYWDSKDGKLISLLKMSYSALTRSKVDDGGIEGKLNV